jgi:hypothetical protein
MSGFAGHFSPPQRSLATPKKGGRTIQMRLCCRNTRTYVHGLRSLLAARREVPAAASRVPSTRQAMTLVTTPEPTVRPPSRMANRSRSSIAIGLISVTTIVMLSPGITISTPSGNSTVPVTSVVRK